MKKIVLTTMATLMSVAAMADQCALISSKTQMTTAATILRNAAESKLSVKEFCEPCGDKKAKSVRIASVQVRAEDLSKYNMGTLYKAKVNGKEIDLAYTYVNGINLAAMVGCPTRSVSLTIK